MSNLITSLYSKTSTGMKHSFVREILKVTKGVPGMISFAGGMPSPKSFPRVLLAGLFKEVILEEGADVLQYGASEGDPVFKRVLKEFEEVPYLRDDEIMITVGSTNGIYFFTRVFVDPGDTVIMEAPGFPGSISAMESCGARCVGVEMDGYGMRADALEQTIVRLKNEGNRIKFIYVIPEFQNPTGKTMSLERRREIIRIALKHGYPILEDSPYRELRYSGERLMTLWEMARTEFGNASLVTIAKSFSKILGPGLRLGFSAGPPEVIGTMVKWAQKSTVSPDCATQRVAARFIEKGYIKTHIEKIKALYAPKRDAMMEALEKHMPPGTRWTRPEGGMFIWVTFPEHIDTDALFLKAKEKKVAFIPGSRFYPEGQAKKNEIRLNFSYPAVDEIKEGISRLGRLLHS